MAVSPQIYHPLSISARRHSHSRMLQDIEYAFTDPANTNRHAWDARVTHADVGLTAEEDAMLLGKRPVLAPAARKPLGAVRGNAKPALELAAPDILAVKKAALAALRAPTLAELGLDAHGGGGDGSSEGRRPLASTLARNSGSGGSTPKPPPALSDTSFDFAIAVGLAASTSGAGESDAGSGSMWDSDPFGLGVGGDAFGLGGDFDMGAGSDSDALLLGSMDLGAAAAIDATQSPAVRLTGGKMATALSAGVGAIKPVDPVPTRAMAALRPSSEADRSERSAEAGLHAAPLIAPLSSRSIAASLGGGAGGSRAQVLVEGAHRGSSARDELLSFESALGITSTGTGAGGRHGLGAGSAPLRATRSRAACAASSVGPSIEEDFGPLLQRQPVSSGVARRAGTGPGAPSSATGGVSNSMASARPPAAPFAPGSLFRLRASSSAAAAGRPVASIGPSSAAAVSSRGQAPAAKPAAAGSTASRGQTGSDFLLRELGMQ